MKTVAFAVAMLGLTGASLAQEAPALQVYDQRLQLEREITLPDATLGRLRVLQPGDLQQVMPIEAPVTAAEQAFLDATIATAFSDEPASVRAPAVQQLQRLSAQGFVDTPALEWALRDGNTGIERPDAEIMADVIRAAEAGNPLSLDIAGRALFVGEAVEPDFGKSHKFLEQLQATAPTRAGSDLLARQYVYGWGTTPDLTAAAGIWKPRADAGDVQASIDYADLLARRGGAEDMAARRTYLEAAAAHDAEGAKYRLFQDAVQRDDPADIARWRGELEALATDQAPAAALLADYYTDLRQPQEAYNLLQRWALEGDGLSAAKLGRLLVEYGEELGGRSSAEALDYLQIGLIEQQPEALLGLGEQALKDGHAELAYRASVSAEATGDARVAAQANELTFATCKALEDACAPVPVLFVTNRSFTSNGDGTVRFGNEADADHRISYGVSTVKVYLSLEQRRKRQEIIEGQLGWFGGLANCANPFIPSITCAAIAATDPNAIAPVTERRNEAGKDFFAWAQSLSPQQGAGPQNVFLFVHGFATNFDGAVRQAASAAETSGFPGVPVLLSWVANDGPFPDVPTRYMSDLAAAQAFCPILRQAITDAAGVFGFDRTKLMAHSMGNVATFQALTGCRPESLVNVATEAPWPDDAALSTLVLAAPDLAVPDAETAALFAALDQRAQDLAVYQSTNDWALNISASVLFNGKRRLGQGGEPRTLLSGAHTIDATNVETIDATYAGISNHFYVFDTPQVARDLSQVLQGEVDRTKRKCIRDEDYNGQAGAYSSILPTCLP